MCWGISLCNNSKENLNLLKWCRNSANLTQLNNYKPPLRWDQYHRTNEIIKTSWRRLKTAKISHTAEFLRTSHCVQFLSGAEREVN